MSERIAAAKDHFGDLGMFGDERNGACDLVLREASFVVEADANPILAFAVSAVGRACVAEQHDDATRVLVDDSLCASLFFLQEEVDVSIRSDVLMLGIIGVHCAHGRTDLRERTKVARRLFSKTIFDVCRHAQSDVIRDA